MIGIGSSPIADGSDPFVSGGGNGGGGNGGGDNGGGGATSGAGVATLPVIVYTTDPNTFEYQGRRLLWRAIVKVGGVDVSTRLTGQMKISAAEQAPRVATFDVVPLNAAQLKSFDAGASVTIDIAIKVQAGWSVYRRFSGLVESADFDLGERVAKLVCRDGYQDRIKHCTTASEVEDLVFGAYPCQKILAWSDATPDPLSYFDGLLSTICGATFIDGSGVWQQANWSIGATRYAFSRGDYFDGSLTLKGADKSRLPVSIKATLTVRFNRLHAAEIPLSWTGPTLDRFVLDGISYPNKSTILNALAGLSGWCIKGEADMTGPVRGVHHVLHNGVDTPFIIGDDAAQLMCTEMAVTMYHRWYQSIDARYSVEIPLGGKSDRDESIGAALTSEWDAGTWETTPSATSPSPIYLKNGPVSPIVKTGYEGFPQPYPPANGSLDYFPDVDIFPAMQHVAAKALRTAVSGLRGRRVEFDRPLDCRLEIGQAISVASDDLSALGQIVEWDDTLDHDSGTAITHVVLACPEGQLGAGTGFSVGSIPDLSPVSHSFPIPVLGNWIGGSVETVAATDDEIIGWLTNVNPLSNDASAGNPFYHEQFRVRLPEIPAEFRDPKTIDVSVGMGVSISGGIVDLVF